MLSLALVAFLGAPVSRPVISVFGHKIPDTDAICAAICYTWELEQRGVPARAFRLGELNRETEYVLATFGVEAPPLLEGALEEGAPVAVVDTNNPKELPDGIEHAALHSVIDHHKLAGLTSPAVPTEIDIRSLCSTGSILYARAKAAGRTPSPQVAGLLLHQEDQGPREGVLRQNVLEGRVRHPNQLERLAPQRYHSRPPCAAPLKFAHPAELITCGPRSSSCLLSALTSAFELPVSPPSVVLVVPSFTFLISGAASNTIFT